VRDDGLEAAEIRVREEFRARGGETRASRDRKERLREALFVCALSGGKAYPSMIPDRTDNPRKMILLTGNGASLASAN
jgi:hypothetical protein